ncbi:alanine racemase [Nocardioides sp. GCM10027113]|uniref:alanine racemase n=1 Tax=unclassified Nocardioides TaxID=2615069 RepID=UPI00360C24D8
MLVDPPTPYLSVDLPRLRQNIRRVAEQASRTGVRLRPHVKTHKCVEIARLQLDAGAVGITVATVNEAEAFAREGFDDIFIAYPLWVDDVTGARLRDVLTATTLTIGIDSVEGAAAAGRLLGAHGVRVLVEVDSGHGRSGVPPEEAGILAQKAARAGLDVRGVFTFPGHSYAAGGTSSAAEDEGRCLAVAADALRSEGIEPEVVSGGSTPSLADSATDVLTEMRPGVYVFGDAQQWELGTMAPEQIALTCRSTVVSHAGGRLVLDAGSKALGADRAPYATGFGRLPAHPDARIVLLSEHHAVADLGGTPLPPIGSRVDVVPNHVCNAVNLSDRLLVEEAGELRSWPVVARGPGG